MNLYSLFKRVFDVVVSLIMLVVLSPAFVVLIITIRLTSKASAIFAQQRAGKAGKVFIFYKFRTMKSNADPFGPSPKSGDDPRLTKIGKFLREYSLDELPQLFNVLKGNMSIVGPRPLYVSQMAEWNQRQKKRLLVTPGLTGLELDVKYVETANFWADMKIIMITIAQVFGRKNIYEKRYSQTEYTRDEKKT